MRAFLKNYRQSPRKVRLVAGLVKGKNVSDAVAELDFLAKRAGGPIASFLFIGPTGVGKTELSKIIAELQFGSAKTMIRLDMSEFQDKQSYFRLIGSPGGGVTGAFT